MSTPRSALTHAPITQFLTVDGQLCVGGVPLGRLAARAGRTPFYAYDRQLISDRVALLRARLPAAIRLHYAVKANPMPALLGHLTPLVDGFDVASSGEMTKALDAGMATANISFAGPGKRHEELMQAVAAGVVLNIESARELDAVTQITTRTGLRARVAIRVNPGFDLKTSGMKMGGGPQPFGIDAEEVPALLQGMAGGACEFTGFHIYAGSQNLRAEAVSAALRQSFELVLQLARFAPAPVRSVNLGGGFGIPYFPGEAALDLAPIAATLAEISSHAAAQLPEAELVLELGRYLVGEAGIYATRVVEKKLSRGRHYLITDGGLNHHLAASGNFGQVIRKNYPVCIGNRMGQPNAAFPVTVAGPLCTPLDVLADAALLPEAEVGDLIAVFQSGAYGASASPLHFLGHPPAVEILV